jgi:hypothetical protein
MIFVFCAMAVVACNKTATDEKSELNEAVADLMLPPKGQPIQLIKELPKNEIRCEFSNRVVCAGGRKCMNVENSAGTYTLIDVPKMSYKRCDKKSCDRHTIESIGSPQGVRNISLGSIGTMVKLGPDNRFIDIATQGAYVFISSGTCSPAKGEE